MIRARTVIIEDGRISLMRRERVPGRVYYVIPGGGVEDGESPEQAAVREAFEELGVHVQIERLLMIVRYESDEHYCFHARILDGAFGTGNGPEFTERPTNTSGSYRAVWMPLAEIADLDIGPFPIKDAILDGTLFDAGPVRTVLESSHERERLS